MKSTKLLTLAMLIGSVVFLFSSCKKTETEYKEKIMGCTNAEAINYNSSATDDNGTCILPDQLEDADVTIYTFVEHSDSSSPNFGKAPWIDHTHSNLEWATDYKDLGYSTLTGRFVNFGLSESMVFNEKVPSKTHFKAWAQLSSIFTGESGRDDVFPAKAGGLPKGCMPSDLGVRVDTTNNQIIESTDIVTLETSGPAEFYYATSKRGFTTSYKIPANLNFKGHVGPVMVYFDYNGKDDDSGRSGFQGYFKFNRSEYGVTAASPGEEITVNFNMQVRYK